MKFIETAIDKEGRSYIYSQTEPHGWPITGHIITDLFFSNQCPSDILASSAQDFDRNFNLKPGQIRFFRSDIYPTKPEYEKLPENEKMPFKKFFYHSTTTIDYITVVAGQLTLIVGEEETQLQVGDCVVQRGAAHAWHNYSNEIATIMGVMIGVEVPVQFKRVDTVQPG
jgi:mannose-6-phosphate isomerase-like protein (cupin superfamily)